MDQLHLVAAWAGILLGLLSGTLTGLFFHSEEWLGGYTSWPRRLIRLGHISFFGLAFVNLGVALTIREFQLVTMSSWTSPLLLTGTAAMPLVCYLSAAKKMFRHLFFVPVLSLLIGVSLFFFGGVLP